MDASHAFRSANFGHYAARFSKLRDPAAGLARTWLYERFGYDLRVPTNLGPCGACDLSPPPAGLLDAWPAWDTPAPGVTAAEYHCAGDRAVATRRRRPLPQGHYE